MRVYIFFIFCPAQIRRHCRKIDFFLNLEKMLAINGWGDVTREVNLIFGAYKWSVQLLFKEDHNCMIVEKGE